MRVDRWPSIHEDPWAFLRKVSSAIKGREVEVRPGAYPRATQVPPKDYFSRILLPDSFTKPGREGLLNGSLAHELLHVLESDPEAFSGIPWGVFIMANGLEDARVETQFEPTWPGLVRPTRQLTQAFLEYRRRLQGMAHSADTSKLYEVSLALYFRLSQYSARLIRETVSEMAAAVAEELLPIAAPALTAAGSAEVVEIAEKICQELAKAAEAAAKRIGTPAAKRWAQGAKTEVKRAMERTVEEVLVMLSKPQFPGVWWGPWYKGRGGFAFYSTKWDWEREKLDDYRALSSQEISRLLQEADPLVEERITRARQLVGHLALSSQVLVQAAVGRDRRVFQKSEREQRMLLLSLLASIDVFIFIEAHKRYVQSDWLLLKGLSATLARLFTLTRTPLLVVRAWHTTRAKEWVENPRTHDRYERWSKDHYINIATLKAPDDPWDEGTETVLAAMPRQGFNNPLEGYPRLKSWDLKLPKSNRPRFYILLGDADQLNVLSGHLKYGTGALRGKGQQAIYLNVGTPIPSYDDRLRELEAEFDGLVQATTLHQAIIDLLYTVVIKLAEQGGVRGA
jgi:hypothetical protein